MGATAGLSSSVARLCTAGQASSGTRNRQNLPVTGGKNCRSRDRTTEKPKPKDLRTPATTARKRGKPSQTSPAADCGTRLAWAVSAGRINWKHKAKPCYRASSKRRRFPCWSKWSVSPRPATTCWPPTLPTWTPRATKPTTYPSRSFKRASRRRFKSATIPRPCRPARPTSSRRSPWRTWPRRSRVGLAARRGQRQSGGPRRRHGPKPNAAQHGHRLAGRPVPSPRRGH